MDHLKLITTLKDKNCDFSKLFNFSHQLVKSFEKYLTFEFDRLYGFTNSCLDSLGAGIEISSLISLKNITYSEQFDRQISDFNIDIFKIDKINCQFFSKKKFKLCDANQLEFIQQYYNFLCGLILTDNKLELKNEEEKHSFAFDFSKLAALAQYSEQSSELSQFRNNPNKSTLNKDEELKLKSIASSYYATYEKYKNVISPLGTQLNDLVSNLTLTEENPGLSFLKNKVYLSDYCEYRAFKSFISKYILNYQSFNIEEYDHIYKQDSFKTLPSISSESLAKVQSTRISCIRNITDLTFGLNNSLFDSCGKAKEFTMQSLETMKKKYAYYKQGSEEFKKIITENEISLNIPSELALGKSQAEATLLNLSPERGVFSLESQEKVHNFYIILNDMDHLRFESFEKSGDVNKMFFNILLFTSQYDKHVKFSYDKQLGFITSNPDYIGTGLIIEVVIQLKHLINDEKKLNEFFVNEGNFKYEILNKAEGLIKLRNHSTIGFSENDLLGNFIVLINDIMEHDKE